METDKRIEILAKHLKCSIDDIKPTHDPVIFEHGAGSYLVLTDDEADDAVAEEIKSSLWAFNAEFIASHTERDLNDRAIAALKDAVSSDKRGHFLSRYDGEEYEVDGWYVYRLD